MRVAQVMAGAQYGGAETFFIRLALALHRAGLDQKVIIRTHADRAESLRRPPSPNAQHYIDTHGIPFGSW